MKLKYPNSLPFIFMTIAAIPFFCYYFALMFGELFIGRPSSTWAIGFFWIPFLLFPPALIGLIFGFIIWIPFRLRKISGEMPRKVLYFLFALLILISISGFGLGLKKISELEHTYIPHISEGRELLYKEQFITNDNLIEIRSISVTKNNSEGKEKIIIVGERGALVANQNGREERFISFDRRVGETFPIDVEGDGVLEFMDRGGGWQPVSLLDSNGRTQWMCPERDSILGDAADSMAAGDLNNDGILEFVVGMNAGGGLHILNAKGQLLLKCKASNVFSVEIVDINKDGSPEILHSDTGQGIVIRKANGEKIGIIKNSDGHFSLLNQKNEGSAPLIFYYSKKLHLIDLKGNFKKAFDLPGGGHNPRGTLVYFNGPDSPPYYAFARTIQATGKKSDLTVFDPNGKLVYYEIFKASYLAISPLPDKEKGFDCLLIGENSRVWLYGMKIHN